MPLHLLLAHDLSPEADWALQQAAHWVEHKGAHLSIAHACPAQAQASDTAQLLQRLVAQGLSTTQYNLHLLEGPAPQMLAQLQLGLTPDITLMGKHRDSDQHGFLGGTLEALASVTHTPLLVITQPPQKGYQQALAAVDFSNASELAAKQLLKLMEPESKLGLLNIFETQPLHTASPEDLAWQCEQMTQLIEALKSPQPSIHLHPVLAQGERCRCMAEHLARYSPQILSLGLHNPTPLRQALVGGLAQSLLQQPPCDLLLLPEHS